MERDEEPLKIWRWMRAENMKEVPCGWQIKGGGWIVSTDSWNSRQKIRAFQVCQDFLIWCALKYTHVFFFDSRGVIESDFSFQRSSAMKWRMYLRKTRVKTVWETKRVIVIFLVEEITVAWTKVVEVEVEERGHIWESSEVYNQQEFIIIRCGK